MISPGGKIFLGTDSGATTSKTGGVWEDGSVISMHLRQSSTNAAAGTEAVVRGWIEGAEGFLADHGLGWDAVAGVGLSIPGPYLGYGIMDRAANLPGEFEGWNFVEDYSGAIARHAGRRIPLVAGNDGNFGGVAEAQAVRGDKKETVVMLAPGSGLGCAYVGRDGLPLDGDTLAGMEAGHMPAAVHLLGGKIFQCGCGRAWGCIEAYTTISGLPQLIDHFLPNHPGHELATSPQTPKEKALSLRGRAQAGDPLALEIFDFQATALGYHVASLAMALDPAHVVIGGGLVDPGSTTPEFRARYLAGIREAAQRFLWPVQRRTLDIREAALGELSQAIGAALVARTAFSNR